jgi:hypothetical protein
MSCDEASSQSEGQRSSANEQPERSALPCQYYSSFSCFFDALNLFFTDPGLLLPNSTALVKTLLTGQLPSKQLRVAYPAHQLRIPVS